MVMLNWLIKGKHVHDLRLPCLKCNTYLMLHNINFWKSYGENKALELTQAKRSIIRDTSWF